MNKEDIDEGPFAINNLKVYNQKRITIFAKKEDKNKLLINKNGFKPKLAIKIGLGLNKVNILTNL